MLKRITRFAPVLGLLIFLLSIATISISAEITNIFYWAAGGVGVLLFLTIFIRGVSQNFSHYVSNTLYVVFVLGTAVLLFEIAQNRHAEWDLTQNKVHSLSPPVQAYLQNLQTRVHLIAFTSKADEKLVAEELRRYTAFSKLLTFETADPYRDVLTIAPLQEYDPSLRVNNNETMAIVYAQNPETGQPLSSIKRQIKISGTEEEQLINGIIQVVNERRYSLYFLQNHGELDIAAKPSEQNQRTISRLRISLEERGFIFQPLDLVQGGVIPADCDIVVCAAPQNDLLAAEVELLANYLSAGGKAMFLINPPQSAQIKLANFAQLLRRFGVNAQTDQVIIDNNIMTKLTGNPMLFPVVQYANHPLVRELGLSGSTFQVFWAMPLAPAAEAEAGGFVYQDLLYSGKTSWNMSVTQLQRQISSSGAVAQPAQEAIAPRSIAAAVYKGIMGPAGETSMKMLVMGDGMCLADQNLKNTQATLFFNVVNWMIEGPQTVAIPPRRLPHTPAAIDPVQQRLLLAGTVFILPSLIFFGGLGYVFLRRRAR